MILYYLEVIIGLYLGWYVFNKFILPRLIRFGMKEIERNPKWAISYLKRYYGLNDIDVILGESKWGLLPRFRVNKETKQLELWIYHDTPINEMEDICQSALCLIIKAKYGLWLPDRPAYNLSVLLYILDGGKILTEDEIKQETS